MAMVQDVDMGRVKVLDRGTTNSADNTEAAAAANDTKQTSEEETITRLPVQYRATGNRTVIVTATGHTTANAIGHTTTAGLQVTVTSQTTTNTRAAAVQVRGETATYTARTINQTGTRTKVGLQNAL